MKRTIKIAAVDFGCEISMLHAVLKLVEDRYEFDITDDASAPFVFHSHYGFDVLKYPGVRIFITGENVSPHMGISDYAMAFDRMTFGDRYRWLPLLRLREAYDSLLRDRPDPETVMRNKSDFCSYVVSAAQSSAPERMRIFDLLSRYKTVNSGGRWRNNVGGPVKDKLAFQRKHKFVIAFENSSTPGYLTEKFVDAAEADAVPIYWGDPLIGTIFNPKAFINCHDHESLEEVVEVVRRVDSDDDAYGAMLAEPWFRDGGEPDCLKLESFREFLSGIFDGNPEQAYRRNRGRWGVKQERLLRRMWCQPFGHAARRWAKKLRGKP